MGRPTVRVGPNERGDWEIALPDRSDPVTCESLDEASRVAYLCAARMRPCELLVRDADHRVLYHELIDSERDGGQDSLHVDSLLERPAA
jgi:hypothetical protein